MEGSKDKHMYHFPNKKGEDVLGHTKLVLRHTGIRPVPRSSSSSAAPVLRVENKVVHTHTRMLDEHILPFENEGF